MGYEAHSEVLDAEAAARVISATFGVLVPPDRYDWHRGQIGIGTAPSRPVALYLEFSAGSFFSGHMLGWKSTLELRPSRHFFGQFEVIENRAELATGDFTQRLVRARLQWVFTPDLSWDTFVQYDNVTDTIGLNSRVRWILRPGEEFAFVFNQGAADVPDEGWQSTNTGLTGKLSWTFRF